MVDKERRSRFLGGMMGLENGAGGPADVGGGQPPPLRRQSEDDYRSIVELAVEGIFRTSASGQLILANPALARICGYASAEEMLFQLRDVARQVYLEPNRRGEFLRLLEEQGEVTNFESQIRRADGRVIWISENARAVRDERGVLRYFEGTVQDISERKAAEEAREHLIREQAARAEAEAAQQRLAFLAEASTILDASLDYETTLEEVARLCVPTLADWCAVYILEADGTIRRLAATDVDPSREVRVGALQERYPIEPGASYGVAQVVRTGQPELHSEISESFLAERARDAEHLELMRALGLRAQMIVPLLARGRTLGALSMVSAESGRTYRIADLALAEDLARRCALAIDNARLYREAQEAIRARDEFLSVAAHELKTPVTSLRGYAQLVLRRLAREEQPDPERVRRGLRVIEEQTEKLTRLVSQLLDVSRIEAGQLRLDRVATELVTLVAGVVAAARANAGQRQLAVHAPAPVWASVDPLRLEQVLTNLIDNAIRYSPGGGAIEVEVVRADPRTVCLSVRDRGIGIPPEHRERVFERFYQVAASSTQGMGLGLYVSRQIVELHGGQMRVETPSDGGTRLSVLLPAPAGDSLPLAREGR